MAFRPVRAPSAPYGLYLHIPFCDGKCAYCAFYSRRYDRALADRLLEALEREIAGYPDLAPETVYCGGGTPSVLSVPQLARLCALIRARLPACGPREWSVEANPGSLDADKLRVLAEAGVNRISLGAQAFDDAVLRRLGRRHTRADIERAVALTRAAGFRNLGLDLIAGVPGAGADVWDETLRRAIAAQPEHVSVYALTAEEGSRLGRRVAGGQAPPPDDDAQLAALDAAEARLTAAGYGRYEISNYAKPGFACRHHLACWRGAEYLGLGPAAASHVGLERRTNRPDLDAYLSALERRQPPPCERETLTPETKQLERIVFGLRMAEGIDANVAAARVSQLTTLAGEGLVEQAGGRWRLTARGRRLADYVAVELM